MHICGMTAYAMTERVYFDWNATTPLRPQARDALAQALALTGNPSSVHAEGRAARGLIEQAREDVAGLVGANPADVVFTSSGTEANALALTPAIETTAEKQPRDRLLMSAIEHSSVRAGSRFAREAIDDLPVDADGRLNLGALRDAVSRVSRPLASVMLANNETGGRPRGRRASARRCGPGRRPDRLQHRCAWRRRVDAVGAQDRRPKGCRCPGAAKR
jgi:cysteine desulfurase